MSRRALVSAIHLAAAAFFSLPLGPGPSAADSCLAIHTLQDREQMVWSRHEIALPPELPASPLLAADLDGDGRDELVLKSSDTLLVAEFSSEGGMELRTLPVPAAAAGHPHLGALRVRGARQDTLTWYSDRSFQSYLQETIRHQGRNASPLWTVPLPALSEAMESRFGWRFSGAGALSIIIRFGGSCGGAHCTCLIGIDYANAAFNQLERQTVVPDCLDSAASVLGDFDGDSLEELLVAADGLSRWYRLFADATTQLIAHFPEQTSGQGSLVGDFNGDALSDIVVYGKGLGNAWIGVSTGSFLIERPFSWPFEPHSGATVAAGDFDGNGTSDLVQRRDDEPRSLDLALSKSAPPARAGLSMTAVKEMRLPILWEPVPLQARYVALPAIEGKAAICNLLPGSYRLFFQIENGSEASRAVTLRPGSTAEVFLITEADPQRQSLRGRAFGFGVSQSTPAACLGYHPAPGNPAVVHSKWGIHNNDCPAGHAYLGTEEGAHIDPALNMVYGACCPLPAADILLGEHVEASAACPDGHVVTGNALYDSGCTDCRPKVRCTRINEARYQLGPAAPGRYWGDGFSGRDQKERLQRFDFPKAIREAIARHSYASWGTEGCVGTPAGALLVTGSAKYCKDSYYRELRYRGNAGDPPAGSPVPMFPPCAGIENVYDPASGCTAPALHDTPARQSKN